MNFDEFDAVFDRFQTTAFRPEPWLRRVADTTAAGARWRRVHVLSRPLTDYLRFEMVGYEANVDADEDVRVADRCMHPELAAG